VAWPGGLPVQFLLAADDSVIDTAACLNTAAALRAAGADVRVTVFDGADHAFDQQERSVLSKMTFDAATRDAARAVVDDLLAEVAVD